MMRFAVVVVGVVDTRDLLLPGVQQQQQQHFVPQKVAIA